MDNQDMANEFSYLSTIGASLARKLEQSVARESPLN